MQQLCCLSFRKQYDQSRPFRVQKPWFSERLKKKIGEREGEKGGKGREEKIKGEGKRLSHFRFFPPCPQIKKKNVCVCVCMPVQGARVTRSYGTGAGNETLEVYCALLSTESSPHFRVSNVSGLSLKKQRLKYAVTH